MNKPCRTGLLPKPGTACRCVLPSSNDIYQCNTSVVHGCTRPMGKQVQWMLGWGLTGRMYDPHTGLVCGLQPVHFMSMATPHLGCDGHGPAQVCEPGMTGPARVVLLSFSAHIAAGSCRDRPEQLSGFGRADLATVQVLCWGIGCVETCPAALFVDFNALLSLSA